MSSLIDHKKLILLGIAMFGVFSVYMIHDTFYQKLIMSPYFNSSNGQRQFLDSQTGMVFMKKGFAWVFAQVFVLLFNKNAKAKQTANVPHYLTAICGFFVFLSSMMFTTGIFEISYRLSFINKCSTYFSAIVFGFPLMYCFCRQRCPNAISIVSGMGMGYGLILYWTYGGDDWFYDPKKNGYFYCWAIILSGGVDSLLSILQSIICEKYQPTAIQLLLKVSRWTAFFSFIYTIAMGDLWRTIEFGLTHYPWLLHVIVVALFYFIGQLFIYDITTKMAQNVPIFITTSRKILTVHLSYALTNHKFTFLQAIGVMVSWLSVLFQIFIIAKKDNCLRIGQKQNAKMYALVEAIPEEELKILT